MSPFAIARQRHPRLTKTQFRAAVRKAQERSPVYLNTSEAAKVAERENLL